jgi:hypothetical protein
MSLQIAVAHTGQRLDADPVAFSSVDALKQWISKASAIPPESQILLTQGGKHVKLQALLTEVEILLHKLIWLLTICPAEGNIRLRPRGFEQPSGCHIVDAAARCLHARGPAKHALEQHGPARMAVHVPGPPRLGL